MMITRRNLLGAAAAATVLAPTLSHARTSDPRKLLEKLPDMKLSGSEQIGMLLYPGFTALDFAGPYHFLAALPGATVHLVTNQPTLSPVASDLGMAIQPTTTMADCPADLTMIFIPGGTAGTLAAARDADTVAFVRDRAARANYVTSVCTGSLILGVAGALAGKRATSHWCAVPLLEQFGAIPERRRVVRDGNLITGAGVSAGMDFGAALVAELRGQSMAEAGILMAEYAPEPPFPGGTIETARPEIADLLTVSLAGFVSDASALRIAP